MSQPGSDRNLLFGILAVQMDFIRRDSLIAAMNAWVLDKAKPLGRILRQQGALSEEHLALLEALVQAHLEQHGNDPQQSLAAVSSLRSVRQDLEAVADAEVQASLIHVSTPARDPESTTGFVPPSTLPPHVRFQILRPHARGGLGEVFVAHDEELDREVALKEIQQRHADLPESRVRFLTEAKVTGSLEHPGIVPVYGLGTYADGRPFYAMRFIQGDSLKDAIARYHEPASGGVDPRRPDRRDKPGGSQADERRLALRDLLGRFVDVCNAIAYAHSRGVLHRDLKPGNIMLGKYGETLVVDWGLAKVLGRAEMEATEGVLVSAADSGLTQAGKAMGTPAYMSPEQAAGRLDRLGPASDVYSLGATLYCLLAGQAPFTDGDAVVVLGKVQKGDFPTPRQVNSGVPKALEAVCLQAMALRPEDRYGSPRELAGEIEHWLADEPVSAYREPLTARVGRWVRRHQTLAAGVGALLLTGVIALAVSTLLIGRAQQQTEKARKDRVFARLNALGDAEPGAVPGILADLEANRDEVLPRLRERYAGEDRQARRMRLALALLPVEPETVRDELVDWLLHVEDPAEVLLVRDALVPHGAALKETLWVSAADKEKPDEQLRALVALAAFDPDGAGWKTHAETAVEQMVKANLLHLGTWVKGLRPVRGELQTPVAKVYREAKSPERREFAARVLADYAAENPALLAELLLDADPKQYAVLFPVVQRYREQIVERMRREVRGEGWWNDPPIDPSWREPSAELRREIETADGLLAERWALCQTLPLERWEAVAGALRECGYRPLRLRPWTQQGKVRVAAVWTRDGLAFQVETNLSAVAAKERDAAVQRAGLLPIDAASYSAANGVRFAVLWAKPGAKGEAARLYVDVESAGHKAATDVLTKEGFIPRTVQGLLGTDGQTRFCGVWWKADAAPKEGNVTWGEEEDSYRGRVLLAEMLLADVAPNVRPQRRAVQEYWRQQLSAAAKELETKPDDQGARYRRGRALFWLSREAEALPDLDAVLGGEKPPVAAFRYRAQVHARAGRVEQARKDLDGFGRGIGSPLQRALVTARLDFEFGDEEKATAALDGLLKAAQRQPDEPSIAWEIAQVYAAGSATTGRRQFGQAAGLIAAPSPLAAAALLVRPVDGGQGHRERAVTLLRQARAAGFDAFDELSLATDLAVLADHASFRELLAEVDRPRAEYASAWHTAADLEAAESHGLSIGAHLERCRELAGQGYRPRALSAVLLGDAQTVTASAWHRPFPQQEERERQARRQATGAVSLLKLDAPADAWPLYRHRPDPEARSQLVWRGNLLGLDPKQIVRRLDEEPDASARRALIVALGEFTDKDLPAADRAPLVEKLVKWYRDDPDPGIHGAIDWLLRHGKEGPEKRPLDWGQAKALEQIDAELKQRDREVASGGRQPPEGRLWYVNGQGQTMVLIPGPVEFRMGAPPWDTDRLAESETPHRRRIPRSVAISSRAVTVAEFEQFLADRPDVPRPRPALMDRYSPDAAGPIVDVSWFTAAQYCNWLSEKEGIPETEWCYPKHADIKVGMKPYPDYLRRKGYRLPSEAEWEYACRAGTIAPRYYGASVELLPRYAWYQANAQDRAWRVGQKRPNDLGLFDMHGNAWAWCQDPGFFYPKQPGTNAILDIENKVDITDSISRALRGGSFTGLPVDVRSSGRGYIRPSGRFFIDGLRLARTYD